MLQGSLSDRVWSHRRLRISLVT